MTKENIGADDLEKIVKETNLLKGPQNQYNVTAVDLYQENVPMVGFKTPL